MRKIIAVLAVGVILSGCATTENVLKEIAGVSTASVEAVRADAASKIFAYDYKTCYDKAEALLREMPRTSIYAKKKDMIAVYVINPNTTPVGIFFTQVDSGHTRVEISSESTPAKEWVARSIFTETVQPAEAIITNL
jgi:uncharacterized protein YceK